MRAAKEPDYDIRELLGILEMASIISTLRATGDVLEGSNDAMQIGWSVLIDMQARRCTRPCTYMLYAGAE